MADDYLKDLPVERVAAWYLRLADQWQANTPELRPALAGVFLRKWVENRSRNARIEFDAPLHLKTASAVKSVQAFHRDVFLTEKKGRFANGSERWAGLLPRLQGTSGSSRWDQAKDLELQYESLCDIAPNLWTIGRIQKFGSNEEKDLFGSLRGFQLKSKVVLTRQSQDGNRLKVAFQSWSCSATDRYDWDYSEYLTVANPDFQSKAPDAIRPNDKTLTVFHSNAKRLEDAGQAAPYDVVIRPWKVDDAAIVGPAIVDVTRRLS